MSNSKKYHNILFLDYDGVINIDRNNFNGNFENPEALYFIEKFCSEYLFKIVVTSSWRNNPRYKEFLYDSGLDKNIEIIGCTDAARKSRDIEIQSYLDNHPEIEKYIIIDDTFIPGKLGQHQVQTTFDYGYTKEKYIETIKRYKNLYENKKNDI